MALKITNKKRNERGRVIHADFEFIPERQLKDFGTVLFSAQRTVDNEMIKHLAAYAPLKTGTLANSFARSSDPGSGLVTDGVVYGHYQNFLDGPVYKTIPANDPRYSGDSLRGGHFIDRVLLDCGQDIIDDAQRTIDSMLKGG